MSDTAAKDATPPADPIGDPRAFERLRRWGGEKLVREMAALFLAQVPPRIAEARAGLAAGELPRTEAAAHTLKSSAGQLGAPRMQALCQQIEALADRGEAAPLPALLDGLEREFAAYLAWLPRMTAPAEVAP